MKWTLAFLLLARNITEIHFAGNSSRLPSTLERAAGIHVGQVASKEALDRACDRLMSTGFISTCKYNWKDAEKGSVVNFDLTEWPATQTIHFAIPGVKEDALWSWIETNDPMLTRKAPDNERATRAYIAAVKRYKPELPEPAINVDLGSKVTTIGEAPAPDMSRARLSAAAEQDEEYTFGKLNIEGVPPFTERRVRAMWKVQEGAKFKQSTVNDFVEEVLKSGILPIEIQNVNPSVQTRSDTKITDVTLKFKGAL